MCGISGIVLEEGERATPALLKAMADSMERRGPDSWGIHLHQNAGLSHRRLSVIDLSEAGRQPLLNEQGNLAVSFNGEIYNFRELRSELEGLGYRFRSASDTEVLIHGFDQWGDGLFIRLNGIFAFAILDMRGQAPVMHLVRDRFGTKPLFYSLAEGKLAFSSEMKALLLLPWIRRTVSPQTLFWYLKYSHVPNPLSILEDVAQVPPGSSIRYENGRCSEPRRYWDSASLVSPIDSVRASARTEESWLSEADEILERVVRRQLVSDVPVGCFLSGGIDSSLLAMKMRKIVGPDTRTFTIGYAEGKYNEATHGKVVADALGTRHHEILVSPKDVYDIIPTLPEIADQPLGDPTILGSLLLGRGAREHVTVALSGDGADEIFFGYPYQRALLGLNSISRVSASTRTRVLGALSGAMRGTRISALQQASKGLDVLQARDEGELLEYFIGTFGPLRKDRLAELVTGAKEQGLAQVPGRFHPLLEGPWAKFTWPQKIEQAFIQGFLTDTVLAKTDRASMAWGLEARVPFLDDEMVEFSSRLPFEYKFRRGTSKYLMRKLLSKMAKGTQIEPLSRRKKQGFSIPLSPWFRAELRYLLDEYLRPSRLKREGIFESAPIAQLVREHLANRANHSHLLWSLISFQLWKERHLA